MPWCHDGGNLRRVVGPIFTCVFVSLVTGRSNCDLYFFNSPLPGSYQAARQLPKTSCLDISQNLKTLFHQGCSMMH